MITVAHLSLVVSLDCIYLIFCATFCVCQTPLLILSQLPVLHHTCKSRICHVISVYCAEAATQYIGRTQGILDTSNLSFYHHLCFSEVAILT